MMVAKKISHMSAKRFVMMVGMLAGLLLVGLLLTACASREGHDSTMQAMVGKNRTALIDAFGRPTVEYKLDGNLYMTYQQATLGVAGASPVIIGQGSDSVFREGAAEDQVYYKKWCHTSFILRRNIVKSFQSKGNNCRR